MKAPTVTSYIHNLRPSPNFTGHTYDERTYELLDKIFGTLKQVNQSGEDRWELWFCADRGTIDDYGSYEEALEFGDVESREQFEEEWLEMFPNDTEWYNFTAVEYPPNNYRAIFLRHQLVIEQREDTQNSFPLNISPFVEWILEQVETCVALLKAGQYNDFIENGLPVEHRTGVIIRKDLWQVYPGDREKFLEGITLDDWCELRDNVGKQGDYPIETMERLPAMSAGDFFRYCAMGYRANNYDFADLSPKEQYYKFADGRDEGLRDIDENSASAFAEWLDNRPMGGHPWEVCRGGNSTHVSLQVYHDEKGYFLYLAGSADGRTLETVRFYLALTRAGIPVYLHDGPILVQRLIGEDSIGIVPDGIWPVYCEEMFPDDDIISFMDLPCEKREDVAEKCSWLPLRRIELVEG